MGTRRLLKFLLNDLILDAFGVKLVSTNHTIHPALLAYYPEKQKPRKPKYLCIGSGSFYHPLWHTLEYVSKQRQSFTDHRLPKIDFNHNLSSQTPLPVESRTVQLLYASHVIEHLHPDDCEFVLGEVHRVLEDRGVFRMVVPDMDLYYDAYKSNDIRWFENYFLRCIGRRVDGDTIQGLFLNEFASLLSYTGVDSGVGLPKVPDEEVDRIFANHPKEEAFDYFCSQLPRELQSQHPFTHFNWFNYEKAERLLRKAGFANIRRSECCKSRDPRMRDENCFDRTSPSISLYVECEKSEPLD